MTLIIIAIIVASSFGNWRLLGPAVSSKTTYVSPSEHHCHRRAQSICILCNCTSETFDLLLQSLFGTESSSYSGGMHLHVVLRTGKEIVGCRIMRCWWFAPAIWAITQVSTELAKPHSVQHMFGNWLVPMVKQRCYYFLKEEFYFSCAGYILNYPLAPCLVHSLEAVLAGFGCGGIPTIGIDDQGYFFPGVCVVI